MSADIANLVGRLEQENARLQRQHRSLCAAALVLLRWVPAEPAHP